MMTSTAPKTPTANFTIILDVNEEAGDWELLNPALDELEMVSLDTIAAAMGKKSASQIFEISLVLTDNKRIRKLNRTHRGKDKATDVLSFPGNFFKTPQGRVMLGDIVIAFETLGKDARAMQIPIESHFIHLYIHGLLHLLGLDHEKATDARKMEKMEIGLLAKRGIENPYARLNNKT